MRWEVSVAGTGEVCCGRSSERKSKGRETNRRQSFLGRFFFLFFLGRLGEEKF